jgi:hypothetical protein
MNILARYLDLARAEQWEDALPIIGQIGVDKFFF